LQKIYGAPSENDTRYFPVSVGFTSRVVWTFSIPPNSAVLNKEGPFQQPRLFTTVVRYEGGDLRFYATVQVYSALALLVAPLFPRRYTRGFDLGIVAGFYVLAKVLETLDRRIFAAAHVVSVLIYLSG